ncbi:hypothetical protein EPN83_01890 [Patescibacteria group bacterium]|nr:MAG: hypothetical protein EPN83_01890 [Patescibacteria group bacterium]
MSAKHTDWEKVVEQVNAGIKKLQRKPKSLKKGFTLHPGSILNAYREGDLTFRQAVRALDRWKNHGR